MKPLDPKSSAAVYHHLNAQGEILYIGCSINPMARFNQHRSQSPWARQVTNISIQWFDTLTDALAEEDRQIKTVRPPMNRSCRPAPRNYRETNGPILLRKWLSKTLVSHSELADAMCVKPLEVEKLLTPRANPRHGKRGRLAAATGGYVPMGAWYVSLPEIMPVPDAECAAKHLEYVRRLFKDWKEVCPTPVLRGAA